MIIVYLRMIGTKEEYWLRRGAAEKQWKRIMESEDPFLRDQLAEYKRIVEEIDNRKKVYYDCLLRIRDGQDPFDDESLDDGSFRDSWRRSRYIDWEILGGDIDPPRINETKKLILVDEAFYPDNLPVFFGMCMVPNCREQSVVPYFITCGCAGDAEIDDATLTRYYAEAVRDSITEYKKLAPIADSAIPNETIEVDIGRSRVVLVDLICIRKFHPES